MKRKQRIMCLVYHHDHQILALLTAWSSRYFINILSVFVISSRRLIIIHNQEDKKFIDQMDFTYWLLTISLLWCQLNMPVNSENGYWILWPQFFLQSLKMWVQLYEIFPVLSRLVNLPRNVLSKPNTNTKLSMHTTALGATKELFFKPLFSHILA